VRYDTFDTSEVLETKLLTGGSGYDVVVPSSSVLARGLAAGALKEIPHDNLKGYANQAATALVEATVREDANIYPPADVRDRLYADRSMSLKDMRQRTRVWTTFRSHQ